MNIYQHTNPDKNNTPFTYLIGWSVLNKWYYGCRYRKGCHPTDLWTTYFTSSDEVKQFRKDHGEPDVIQVRHVFSDNKQAKLWESRVQTAIPRASRIHWLNKKFGDTFANVVDGFTGKKKSAKSKLRQKETMMQKYGVENGGQTEKSKAAAKARMLTSDNPAYHQTEETRKKIAATNIKQNSKMTAEERSKKFGTFGEANAFHAYNKSLTFEQMQERNAKFLYTLVTPDMQTFTTISLHSFCKEHGLSRDALREHLNTNQPVPPPKYLTKKAPRIATIGWTVTATLRKP